MVTSSTDALILFDGECNLCNGAVQFVIKRDRDRVFRFASLQSRTGEALLTRFNRTELLNLDSIVLVEHDQFYTHSTAALRIARHLRGAWAAVGVLLLLPAALRDPVYNLIARNRYRLLGKSSTCWLPTPELRQRFLS